MPDIRKYQDMTKHRLSDSADVGSLRKRPLLVEFIGRPGSGKSTICQALADIASNTSHVHIVQPKKSVLSHFLRRARLKYLLSFMYLRFSCRREPYIREGVFDLYLAELSKNEQSSAKECIRRHRLVTDLTQHCRLRDSAFRGVFVIDEGVAHRGASALLSGVPKGVVFEHYKFMPLSDLYIFVDAEDKFILDRLTARDGSASKIISSEDYRAALHVIEARGRQVVPVSGLADPYESAHFALRAILDKCLSSS